MDTYEKKYKEAFKEAEKIHKFSSDIAEIKRMEQIFPELCESEDERIRKAIIEYLRQRLDKSPSIPAAIGSWISWLEKQGEYKSPEELLKIRQELYQSGYNDGYKHGCEDSKKQGEQKPAWSEEDERILDALITSLNNEVFVGRLETLKGIEVSSVIDWLKSIKTKSIL